MLHHNCHFHTTHNISTCNKHKKCILNNSLPTFDSSLQLSIGMYKLMFEVALGPGWLRAVGSQLRLRDVCGIVLMMCSLRSEGATLQ